MKPINRIVLIAWIVIAALAGPRRPAHSAEKPAKLAPLRIAYVSRSILDMPFIIARDRVFFREEGLVISTRGRPTASALMDLPINNPRGTAEMSARTNPIEMRFRLA